MALLSKQRSSTSSQTRVACARLRAGSRSMSTALCWCCLAEYIAFAGSIKFLITPPLLEPLIFTPPTDYYLALLYITITYDSAETTSFLQRLTVLIKSFRKKADFPQCKRLPALRTVKRTIKYTSKKPFALPVTKPHVANEIPLSNE